MYVSPYRRTLHTLALLGLSPAWTVQEPRLREQDWGNLQDAQEQRRQREERDFFGHFFYRLESGESGADVDDRLAAFLTELRIAPPDADVLLVVTHGLAMRLLARRALGWSVPLFERCPTRHGEERVLTLDDDRWRLDRPFAQWQDRRRRDDAVARADPTLRTRGVRPQRCAAARLRGGPGQSRRTPLAPSPRGS